MNSQIKYIICKKWILISLLGWAGIFLLAPKEASNEQNQEPYLIKEYRLDGPGMLKVFTFSGDIEVYSVSDSDNVRVELYVERGYALWSNTKSLDNYRIINIQRGNEVVASVERKSRETGIFTDRTRFSYRIYVPESISTDLKTMVGNVRLSGVKGNQFVRSSGGNIDATGLKGLVRIHATAGNITVQENSGTIHALASGGNIVVRRSEGEMRLKTEGGDIVSEGISGTFIARVEGGNIRTQLLHIAEGINLETTAGNIYAELPGKSGFDLYASGLGVTFEDRSGFEGRVARQEVNGSFKNGGPPVNIKTSSGTITIKIR